MIVNGYKIEPGANLSGANLSGADLSWANLSRANLSRANLSRANLSRANLSWANLSRANLSGANLSGADLSWANLSRADLSGANLSRAINIPPLPHTIIVGEGVLRVYKRVATPSGPGIAILEIPAHALRSNGTGRKCRASEARVLECPDGAHSLHAPAFKYVQGSIIKPTEPFDTNRWNECAPGIHFFLTREEAEEY